MQILIRIVSLSLFCSLVASQAATIQGHVVTPLAVSAGWSGSGHPVGPISPGGFNLAASDPSSWASMEFSTIAVSAYASSYEFRASCSSTYSWQYGAAPAQCAGVFELLLTRPSPTPVQVTIGAGLSGAGGGATCQTLVDINADGSNEADLCTLSPTGLGNYNLMVGPGGTRIRITHSSSAAAGFNSQFSMAFFSMQLTVTSGPASLDSYGAGCFELEGDITQAGDLLLACPAAPGSLVVLALGTTPLSMPLSFTPGCLLLLQPLVTITATPIAGEANFIFPGAAPPPGLSFQLQSARLDPAGVITTSNGLTVTGL